MAKVSVDFDDTLCMAGNILNKKMAEIIFEHASCGDKIVVMTSRNPTHDRATWIRRHNPLRISVKDFIELHQLPIFKIHYTNHRSKGPRLAKMGVSLHYDNDPVEVASCEENGVKCIKVCDEYIIV